ncbi:MAG: PEP-CTERM sorting domain-containing protein [Acidobacteria bacterium]|nr:PEP-CTERM sorting domain-containing protein [Acidobacteriota bacterium]
MEFYLNYGQGGGMSKLPGDPSFGILRRVRGGLLGTLVLAAFGGVAPAAQITWNLEGVTFSDGATAVGTFEYDTVLNLYTNWSITTSTSIGYAGFTYRPGTSTAQACCTDELRLTSTDTTRVLNLDFNDASDPGMPRQTINPGRETIPGSQRNVSAGDIVLAAPQGVPEPSSSVLLALGGVLLFLKKVRART